MTTLQIVTDLDQATAKQVIQDPVKEATKTAVEKVVIVLKVAIMTVKVAMKKKKYGKNSPKIMN
jgi:hypothetical protein